jgi:Domain of unknown function (DUF4258)
MFERGIGTDDVLAVISAGETIVKYPEDRPYESELLLGVPNGRAIHVVVARDSENDACIVITAYEPSGERWASDFRRRKPE